MSDEFRSSLTGANLSAEQRLAVSERRHLLLAENTRDVVWSMSPTGQITYVSPAIEKLRGLSREQAMSQPLDQIVTPDSRALVVDYFERLHAATANGEPLPTYRGDLEYYRKDGTTFWTEVFACGLTDADGQLIEVLGVTRDIDERKQYEDRLKEAREQAEQANQAAGKFLAHVSHEMRTPLSTLLSWLHLATERAANAEQAELMGKAQQAGQLLLSFINDLLDVSRMEQSALTLAYKPFSLRSVMTHVDDLSQPLCQSQSTTYSRAVSPNIPDTLIGDPTRLTQALLNLTSNAAKFTSHGNVQIWVELVEQTETGIHLRFNVRDTGTGIAPEWHARLFNEQFQVPNTVCHQRLGTGLGLSITKRLANLMGGDVGFQSMLGQGSTFWFTAQVGIEKALPAASLTQSNDTTSLRGKRVLVVEDYDSLRQAMCQTLKGLGIQPDSAANGVQALEKLKQSAFDLVLMDLYMPVMDGQTCTTQIRQDPQLANIPIIGLSAARFAEDRKELLALGMNDYLLKPFKVHDLVATMKQQIDRLASQSSPGATEPSGSPRPVKPPLDQRLPLT